jgi:hypothetical protein
MAPPEVPDHTTPRRDLERCAPPRRGRSGRVAAGAPANEENEHRPPLKEFPWWSFHWSFYGKNELIDQRDRLTEHFVAVFKVTMKNRMYNIYQKLGVKNRVQLFRLIRANAQEQAHGRAVLRRRRAYIFQTANTTPSMA